MGWVTGYAGTLEERLNDKWEPVPEVGCWIWTGATMGGEYGSMYVDGKNQYAHRVSYELHHGPIPAGKIVRHKCDTPACVNPDHLELGTQADNIRDRDERGRANQRKGAEHGQAKLTEADVLKIRERYAAGGIPHRVLAEEYGVGQPQIGAIIRRECWSHI